MKTKFSEYLTALRRKNGYTQAQIAQRLGISRSSYANYENGNRSPNFEVLEQIADVLDCSLDELFGRHRGFSGNPTRDLVFLMEGERRNSRGKWNAGWRSGHRIFGSYGKEYLIMWTKHR